MYSIKYEMEKEMATHSSILAWEIPWTEDPGGLQSMGAQKSQTKRQQHEYGKVASNTFSFVTTLIVRHYLI